MAPGKLHGNATMAYGMRRGRRNEDKKKEGRKVWKKKKRAACFLFKF